MIDNKSQPGVFNTAALKVKTTHKTDLKQALIHMQKLQLPSPSWQAINLNKAINVVMNITGYLEFFMIIDVSAMKENLHLEIGQKVTRIFCTKFIYLK